MHTIAWRAMVPVVLVALILSAGCHAIPQTPHAAKLDDPGMLATSAPLYWHNHRLPVLPAGAKIALVEFSVEYVEEKLESPTKAQPVIFGTEYGITGLALTAVGVSKTRLELDGKAMPLLPDEMHDIFVRELESYGLTVLPDADVRKCASYALFTCWKPGSAYLLQRLDFTGSDTGNAKQLPVYPSEGHIAVKGARNMYVKDAEAALLKECGADAVVRARFRVGLYKGRAAVERGSKVFVTTASGSGELRAVRSLVSESAIAEKGSFKLFRGTVYSPEWDRFRSAILETFPPYASMAVGVLRQ